MDKTIQDLAWACLPKVVRDFIKNDTATAWQLAYARVFGSHNLTSDTEPEEMLMVDRKKVQDAYKVIESDMRRAVLEELFGNKCLPDKENLSEVKPNLSENLSETKDTMEEKDFGKEDNFPTKELEHGLEQTSVQVEPKFKVGDKVLYGGVVRTIGHISSTSPKCRLMNGDFYAEWVNESQLEPYTEPSNVSDNETKNETKNNMKANFVRRSDEPDNTFEGVQSAATAQHIEEPEDLIETFKCGDIVYLGNRQYRVLRVNKFGVKLIKEGQTWYTRNALSKDRELNLCELLKVGDAIYSPTFGERIVDNIMPDRLCDSSFICYKNGKIWEKGECVIYPSRALYEKYPLDAYSAWMEWKEGRKQKYQVRAIIEYWEVGKSSKWTTPYNIMVSTKEEAQQAAEVVKNTLRKFHEQNTKI